MDSSPAMRSWRNIGQKRSGKKKKKNRRRKGPKQGWPAALRRKQPLPQGTSNGPRKHHGGEAGAEGEEEIGAEEAAGAKEGGMLMVVHYSRVVTAAWGRLPPQVAGRYPPLSHMCRARTSPFIASDSDVSFWVAIAFR